VGADPLLVPLAALCADDLALAGGKGANLGELVRAGFDVPDGFVVTTHAYRLVAAGADAPPSPDQVAAWRMPADVARAIGDAYARLGAGPVAVRSSATAEDLPGAAFAGQQDTFLNVDGADAVVEAVRRCWGSLWTDRAVVYRRRLDIDPASVAIAVVVQQMVPAEYAGVMFTANPVTGDRDQVVIDSNPGLGEAVVSGLVTPDHAVLDSANRIVERLEGRPETVLTARGDSAEADHPADGAPRLSAAVLSRIADVGRRVARHFGRPQDIEWAIRGGDLQLLQARPMTALPPAPMRLNRARRLLGATLLELLPRRPYPMEVSAWVQPSIGTHLERMLMGLAGMRVRFEEMIPAVDGVVQAFVPPAPTPTRRTPARLWRTAGKARRLEPDSWRADPRHARYVEAAARANKTDPATLSWTELLAVPAQVGDLVDVITGLRVDYLPAAGAALARLRLLLLLLGRSGLFGELIVNAPTMTKAANEALDALAEQARLDPDLTAAFGQGVERVADVVAHAPQAEAFRTRLRGFLAEFGHRETGSILLVRDPTWGEAVTTVLALVQVLLDRPAARTPALPTSTAVEALTAHPVVRLTRGGRRVERLVHQAAAGVALREDTHFELTRLMPAVRRVVDEAGLRLQRGAQLDRPEDVWMLTVEDLTRNGDPEAGPGQVDLRQVSRRRRSEYAELASSPLIATATLYPPRTKGSEGALLTGVGGGSGKATGRVRVIEGPAEFATLKPGEVLVCPATNPSWTPLFQRAAAVVVDNGGVASHAAIVAREYGVPAVMGTAVGTSVLSTGQLVEVDGDAGTVQAAESEHR
jgi:phosphohistidine swiveling domain-containing protein